MEISTAAQLDFVGGRLCLDFINTAAYDGDVVAREHLRRYADVLAWGRHVDLLPRRTVAKIERLAERTPAEATAAHGRVMELRTALIELFSDHGNGGKQQTPRARRALALYNREIAVAGRCRLAQDQDGFRLDGPTELADWLVGPVAISAAALLTSTDMARVCRCEGDGCGWFFLDGNRGRARRWCSMAVCGNRAKARLHYDRHRRSGAKA